MIIDFRWSKTRTELCGKLRPRAVLHVSQQYYKAVRGSMDRNHLVDRKNLRKTPRFARGAQR